MPLVTLKENEKFDSLLRRFVKAVKKDGILQELRKREHYEKPSVKRKRKKAYATKRAQKDAREALDSKE